MYRNENGIWATWYKISPFQSWAICFLFKRQVKHLTWKVVTRSRSWRSRISTVSLRCLCPQMSTFVATDISETRNATTVSWAQVPSLGFALETGLVGLVELEYFVMLEGLRNPWGWSFRNLPSGSFCEWRWSWIKIVPPRCRREKHAPTRKWECHLLALCDHVTMVKWPTVLYILQTKICHRV